MGWDTGGGLKRLLGPHTDTILCKDMNHVSAIKCRSDANADSLSQAALKQSLSNGSEPKFRSEPKLSSESHFSTSDHVSFFKKKKKILACILARFTWLVIQNPWQWLQSLQWTVCTGGGGRDG